ncbi:hypothetical protein HRbin22_01647 [Candidatus Thermoflexus japonica]|uniref:Uncharacterized protein n=1 Tax=Candidatus Thermoflexus japonica TaxID=2035417 RepID=A0A2H5Y7I1_9CHLR|nr:hypothetical protein HRbin22_01647 [Candidatus Thermoflexus japonica]
MPGHLHRPGPILELDQGQARVGAAHPSDLARNPDPRSDGGARKRSQREGERLGPFNDHRIGGEELQRSGVRTLPHPPLNGHNIRGPGDPPMALQRRSHRAGSEHQEVHRPIGQAEEEVWPLGIPAGRLRNHALHPGISSEVLGLELRRRAGGHRLEPDLHPEGQQPDERQSQRPQGSASGDTGWVIAGPHGGASGSEGIRSWR